MVQLIKVGVACGLIVLALLCGCSQGIGVTVTGSGVAAKESRAVSGFREIELAGSGELIVQQTGSESLTIDADDNILPLLTSDVSSGQLRLGVKNNVSISPTRPIVYHITTKELTGLSVSGSAKINATAIDTTSLKVHISGSGKIDIAGKADEQEIHISGSADYLATELASRDATVNISGSGKVFLKVSEKLDVSISGSGRIEYIGQPRVSQHISGSGSVVARP